MNVNAVYFIIPAAACCLVLILMPLFSRLAWRYGLTDKPNARKVHQTPVPVIGGLVVYLSSLVAFFAFGMPSAFSGPLKVLLTGYTMLMLIGLIDDKLDIRASFKLAVQLALAYLVFASGINIDTLFGLFGVSILPEPVQFFLTLLVVTGTVNAINLTDGIDGLAAGISLVGFMVFTILAMWLKQVGLAMLFLAVAGGLLAFLRFNLSKQKKVFMGDAGSLSLGFLLVVSALMLLQASKETAHTATTFTAVIGVLILPVIDSLRVYRKRIKRGYSPFRPDRTHLHHLVLNLGVSHKKASHIIVSFMLVIMVLAIIFGTYFSVTLTLVGICVIFGIFSGITGLNQNMVDWEDKIRQLEKKWS